MKLAQNVPHLKTALTGPLQIVEKILLEHQVTIETWLRNQWRLTAAAVLII